MADVPVELARRIALLASDRESGASDILDAVVRLLRDALAVGAPIRPVARALCRAQPSMAPVWNAALEALVSGRAPHRFERFAQRVARAPEALRRFAAGCFSEDDGRAPLRLVDAVVQPFGAHRDRGPRSYAHAACRLQREPPGARGPAAGLAAGCLRHARSPTSPMPRIGHALASADAVLVRRRCRRRPTGS